MSTNPTITRQGIAFCLGASEVLVLDDLFLIFEEANP